MLFKESLISAISSIRSNSIRSFLTSLAIIIGTAAVIAVIGIGSSAEKALEASIDDLGGRTLYVAPGQNRRGAVTKGIIPLDIKDAEGTVFGTKVSNAQGIVEYIIECDVNTILTGSKVDYESDMTTVAGTSEEEVSAELLLTPIEEIILANKNGTNVTARINSKMTKIISILMNFNRYCPILDHSESQHLL